MFSEFESETAYSRLPEPLGNSDAFLRFQEALSRVAKIERPALIIGERGTGKELAAHRLHFLSRRWERPLVCLNCAALAPSLLESELFGYEAGAFTGANKRRAGRFEMADGGTLFLDEIGHLSMEVQAKILRVAEYGSFERLGGSESVQVDVRLIGATNVDLPQKVAEGAFMPDLLDRLAFEVLTLPPLRLRHGDIELLALHFAERIVLELGWSGFSGFSDEAFAALCGYRWPGNIRELKNVVERSIVRAEGELVESIVFDPFESSFRPASSPAVSSERDNQMEEANATASPKTTGVSFKDAIKSLELDYLKDALRKSRHNQKKAAVHLGITYHQFRGLYRKYGKALSED